jgi:predicted metal-dependent HD superfamily phosphohydrolase
MNRYEIESLAERFRRIVRGCGSHKRNSAITAEFEKDVARYTGHTRFYHSLNHVKGYLDLIDEHEHLFARPDEARFAAVKHDTIYNVEHSRDNETLSAIDASHTAERLLMHEESRERIVRFVLATEHLGNKTRVLNDEEKLFADLDLDGFSRSFDSVLQNSRQIRREYSHVPDAVFWDGHTQFLGLLEMRGFIYLSPQYRKYETLARENIAEIRRSRDSIIGARPTDKVRRKP